MAEPRLPPCASVVGSAAASGQISGVADGGDACAVFVLDKADASAQAAVREFASAAPERAVATAHGSRVHPALIPRVSPTALLAVELTAPRFPRAI
jgi:hypothetical protein